jgi:hypothetical protein
VTFGHMISVLQAAKAGKPIQFRIAGSTDEWSDATSPKWNFDEFDYRAIPEPREWWLSVGGIGHPLSAWDSFPAAESQSHCHRPIRVREVIE